VQLASERASQRARNVQQAGRKERKQERRQKLALVEWRNVHGSAGREGEERDHQVMSPARYATSAPTTATRRRHPRGWPGGSGSSSSSSPWLAGSPLTTSLEVKRSSAVGFSFA